MQNEIELKIMLFPENIPLITTWLSQQKILECGKLNLGNTYYDTPDKYFARHKMGLRVRTQDNQHEITLKMKGAIVGGLHIRPEYNLDLPNNIPDFKGLVHHYNLQFDDNSILNAELSPVFSTDFERHYWLIEYHGAQIEIALDQGLIKNNFGQDDICEIEFELKQGEMSAIFALLETMPKADGMWLSSLSKAQRGYLVGNADEIAKICAKLTPGRCPNLIEAQIYQFTQKLADFVRLTKDETLMKNYQILDKDVKSLDELTSANYLIRNLQVMRNLCK